MTPPSGSLRVLDFFSGTGSATQAFRDVGDEIVSFEIDESFPATFHRDLLTVTPAEIRALGPFDFTWASPPCTVFSRAGLPAHHIEKTPSGFRPSSEKGREGWALALKAMELCEAAGAPYLIENPRSLMHLGPLAGVPFVSITYCQYGGPSMKRTVLMSRRPPPGWNPRPECRYMAPCHPRGPPRGSKTGVQGQAGARERGRVPLALSQDIRKALVAPEVIP